MNDRDVLNLGCFLWALDRGCGCLCLVVVVGLVALAAVAVGCVGR